MSGPDRSSACSRAQLELGPQWRGGDAGGRMVALRSELDAEIQVEGDVATLESPLPSLEGLPTLSSTCSTMARSDRPLPSTEAAALEAELGTEARAGEDVASLGTPLPSSEGLPASGSTSSSPERRLGPLPAVGRVEAVGEHASEEQGTEMGSGGAAEATDGASMVAVAEDGRTNGSRRSPPGPAAASTCPALVAAACALEHAPRTRTRPSRSSPLRSPRRRSDQE